MGMNHPVFAALLPIVLIIALGFIAAKTGLARAESVKDISNLTFNVFLPPLLFRTMANMHVENLQALPIVAYMAGMVVLYALVLLFYGVNRRAAVLGLGAAYGNTVMIGIALVGFAYGEQGLAILLSLISVHALIMLTCATVMLELIVAKENRATQADGIQPHIVHCALLAVKNALLQPVTLPIILGLAYAQTGWGLHEVIDKPLQMLGAAFSPLAVVLVGMTLAATPVGAHIRMALTLTALKNFGHPVLVAIIGSLLGLHGLPLTVMVVAASLPMGANAFLFAQRYNTVQADVSAGVAVSTAMALVSVALALWLAPMVPRLG